MELRGVDAAVLGPAMLGASADHGAHSVLIGEAAPPKAADERERNRLHAHDSRH